MMDSYNYKKFFDYIKNGKCILFYDNKGKNIVSGVLDEKKELIGIVIKTSTLFELLPPHHIDGIITLIHKTSKGTINIFM